MSDNSFVLDFDLHIHTFHSPCGRDEMIPEDIIRTAAGKGLTQIGITDHLYPFTDQSMFDDIRSKVEKARRYIKNAPEVFLGCEAEIMAPGRTTGSPELAERLDYVMVAFTHFQNKGITEFPETNDLEVIAKHYLAAFEYAVSLEWAFTVAHPFLVIPEACSPDVLKLIRESDLTPLLKKARDNDIAMEISARALFHWQGSFSIMFYKLCKELGLRFTIGSDAHSLDRVGDIQCLKPLIAEAGLTRQDFKIPQSKGS